MFKVIQNKQGTYFIGSRKYMLKSTDKIIFTGTWIDCNNKLRELKQSNATNNN